MPVTSGLVLGNQAILTARPPGLIANLEHKSGWTTPHQRSLEVPNMGQQSPLYVLGLTDVNPFARIRDSIHARGGRCIHMHGVGCKWPRNGLAKRHVLNGCP